MSKPIDWELVRQHYDPAMAAARGVFKRARIKVASCFI
jgi:hypothetical protein